MGHYGWFASLRWPAVTSDEGQIANWPVAPLELALAGHQFPDLGALQGDAGVGRGAHRFRGWLPVVYHHRCPVASAVLLACKILKVWRTGKKAIQLEWINPSKRSNQDIHRRRRSPLMVNALTYDIATNINRHRRSVSWFDLVKKITSFSILLISLSQFQGPMRYNIEYQYGHPAEQNWIKLIMSPLSIFWLLKLPSGIVYNPSEVE